MREIRFRDFLGYPISRGLVHPLLHDWAFTRAIGVGRPTRSEQAANGVDSTPHSSAWQEAAPLSGRPILPPLGHDGPGPPSRGTRHSHLPFGTPTPPPSPQATSPVAVRLSGSAEATAQLPPPEPFPVVADRRFMSLRGISDVVLLLLATSLLSGLVGWSMVVGRTSGFPTDGLAETTSDLLYPDVVTWALIFSAALLILTLIVPKIGIYTAFPQALLNGLSIGAVAHVLQIDGGAVVLQGALSTVGVLVALLLIYGRGVFRSDSPVVDGFVAAVFGVVITTAITSILSAFPTGFDPFWVSDGKTALLVSAITAVIAAVCFVLNLEFIEQVCFDKPPAHMNWYAAMGLLVSLVWMYVGLLMTVFRLQARFGPDRVVRRGLGWLTFLDDFFR